MGPTCNDFLTRKSHPVPHPDAVDRSGIGQSRASSSMSHPRPRVCVWCFAFGTPYPRFVCFLQFLRYQLASLSSLSCARGQVIASVAALMVIGHIERATAFPLMKMSPGQRESCLTECFNHRHDYAKILNTFNCVCLPIQIPTCA